MREFKIDDLVFDCRVSGNEENELVILLHGFPESSYVWREIMADISGRGFYCIAPNLRGYSKGARPHGKKNYSLNKLATDVVEIAKYAGREKFHLIGHDWGSAIGWKVAHDYPRSLLSWTGLSVPHLQSFFKAVRNDQEQIKMSRYIKDFQWPLLPELKIQKNDFQIFRELWKNSSNDEVEDYLTMFRGKGALTSALNYYRSNYDLLKEASKKNIMGDITVPTLFIWGEHDEAIGSSSVEDGHQYCIGYYKFLQLDGGHFLIQTKSKEVKTAISEHLTKFRTGN